MKNAHKEQGQSIEAGIPPVLTKHEWLKRCAEEFKRNTHMDDKTAMEYAESQLEFHNGDLTEDPEQSAWDEMSYWDSE